MTEKPDSPHEDCEPVSKRTRRSGIVASVGDPNLKDRSKVAPLFLTKKEKMDKLYQKEQEKLAQSTKARLNDWKTVIGVEKDVAKVCPVFQKASVASAAPKISATSRSSFSSIAKEPTYIMPIQTFGTVPDPYEGVEMNLTPIITRKLSPIIKDDVLAEDAIHSSLNLGSSTPVDLVTPCKPLSVAPTSAETEFWDIDKPLQTACLAALSSMANGKHPAESTAQLTEWVPTTTRDWCAARLEPKRQHSLAKWLAKWKDEDAAVRRNRIAPILLISGGVGCGKTSLVYAAASELNIQVLEVSPSDFSWQSNGKRQMSEAVKEALQSRQVKASHDGLSQIVLIDDVDVLVKEDRSVLNAIVSMTDDSKRPLVLTCTDESLITSSSVDISQIFPIEAVDDQTCSFLVYAYQFVLGGGKTDITRKECDLVTRYARGDLRRIAMASQMRYIDDSPARNCFFPPEIFGINFDCAFMNNYDTLLRCLRDSESLNLPMSLRSKSLPDIPSCVFNSLTDDIGLDKWLLTNQTLSLMDIRGMDASLGAQACLKSITAKVEWESCRNASTKLADSVEDILQAFFYLNESIYLSQNLYRKGVVLHHLGVMAQHSNSSSFNSRRVRCILDQAGEGVRKEVNQIRTLFPNNQL